MKKLIIAFAIIAALAITIDSVFARGWGKCGNCNYSGDKGFGPGYGHGFRHLEFMKTELGLTDKQVKQIFDIGTQYREKYFENRNNPDKINELRTEHKKAVEAVFTKEQAEKFNTIKNKGNAPYKRGGCPYNW